MPLLATIFLRVMLFIYVCGDPGYLWLPRDGITSTAWEHWTGVTRPSRRYTAHCSPAVACNYLIRHYLSLLLGDCS